MSLESTLPTCYRHPDRQTRLACTRCDRPICVDCLHRASVGQRCPDCAEAAPVLTAADLSVQGRRTPVFTYAVLGVCVAIFAIGFVSQEARVLTIRQGAQINPAVAAGEWWRLLTSAFLHADMVHLAFNMWALSIFGPPLEREVGRGPFAALYLAAAIAGGAAFFLTTPGGTAVGASGAIFGLFGAWLAASVRNRRSLMGQANLRALLVLLGINLALPLFVPGIAWQAHLGGLVAGFVVAMAWLSMRPEARFARTVVAVAVAVGGLALVVAG